MGLQFYFGGSGAGKSRQLHKDIVAWAGEKPACSFLFLVPDQFTMQTQVDLVNASGCGGIMNIDVLSFGRLAHRIFEETGYGNKPVLDDTGKSLVLRKVAADLKEEMPVIGKNLNKIGYIHEVKSAISEFMQYGISPGQVGEMAEFAKGRGTLHSKLKDLEVIYRGFVSYIQERFITTEETLELLTRAVGKSGIIRDSVIIFDGFTGFTPIQYRLIQELLRLTNRVIVSITIDIRENPFKMGGEQELFSLSKKTVRDLCGLAKEAGVERTNDIFLNNDPLPRFKDNAEMAHLEKQLFRYPMQPYAGSEKGCIRMMEALNPAKEVRQVCVQIKKLVLEEGYSYRDIAVVTGDLETYAGYFERDGLLFDIPVFLDRTRGLLLNPLIEYIRSALKIVLSDFSYESVFHFLRCGLTDFAPEEIDRLENYVLALGIRGKKKWGQMFVRKADKNTHVINEENGQEDGENHLLEKINYTRTCFMEQIAPLLEKRKTAGELVRVLYDFIVKGKIQEKLCVYEKYFAENGERERAREYAQVYRLVMELLEQIMELLEKEPVTLKEFADILDAGFAEIEVGTIPGSVDRTLVGDMERSRLKQVKVLFFLGINDGNIPKGSMKGGIISDLDREFLQQSEFELAPTPRQKMYIQRLYLYMNMTKPSDRLYLSFFRISSQGKSARPSYLIDVLRKLFPQIQVDKADVSHMPFEQIVGKKDGLTLLSEEIREYAAGREGILSGQELGCLYHVYAEDEQYGNYAGKLMEAAFAKYEHKPLAKAVARALYGKMLENSVSRLERYAACAYSHFLQYGLMLKEREEFSFEQTDLGNIFHEVLEVFAGKLAENKLTWFDFTRQEGEKLLREALEAVTASYGENILYSSARYEYMVERMYRILKRTIFTLRAQLREGDFSPAAFELSFSKAKAPEAVDFSLSDDEKMRLRGRIDRIDTCEDEDHVYVKVIDYKSGNKKFDLAALYFGLQLQLVVYMNVAVKMTEKSCPGKEVVPAALLYYHVDDPMVKAESFLSEEEIDREILKELRTTGIVNEDEKVVSRLDKNFTDKSLVIPVERKKDGSFSQRSSTMGRADYETVSRFVNHKIREFGRQILEGNIEMNPCRQGVRESCTYCAYKGVCEFEERLPGCNIRQLPTPPDDLLLEKMREEILPE
ncbi:helicase-exonuclease AddAB subunit AddB [Parablautia intestinalis]|uniref:Helicase-exonuclease AddAB subunit AddB n=1 Tax=Parablautia intestinalis TaxID=2320100 RepID=A0A3A9APL9_9FIRM|nr:helicase-exonuclease AddAB subunit AddB [Parablautia intestinalis]RKI93229.1 helicase-exonuclease AddAB subunit AddB [Parablautia intestinalis]